MDKMNFAKSPQGEVKLKTRAITLIKEDVLSLGRLVNKAVSELQGLLTKAPRASFEKIEQLEDEINKSCLNIEEKSLDVLCDRSDLSPQEVRTLVGSTLIATKFERLADHALRVAKFVSWIAEEDVEIPPQMAEMTGIVNRMIEDVLLCFVSDATDKIPEIIQRDSRVDYLHDFLSKTLLSNLGDMNSDDAQTSTQFLFCTRYLERMGDACTSIAKRIYFIVTGERMSES
ncbi:MAG: hypothetical protein K2W95_02060 [Candidatus Obscuribacterales bacterium]|nr:hypothetical protein [Candidatus Obscuribacterales bacterium]